MEISLAVAIALILAAAISYEAKISSAVLEILAGMVLAYFIADIETESWLTYLSTLGMMALMFVAGFEIRIKQLKKLWVPSLTVGVMSFTLPFVGVFFVCHFWLGLAAFPSALIGVGLSTTSLALVYHLLMEQGALDTDDGQIMFGAASVVDIISMVMLAMLMGEWGVGTILFAGIFVFSAFTLPRIGDWIFNHYSYSIAEMELRFLLAVIIGMGFMAENIGSVHPALVAFTIGVFMSRIVEHNKVVKDKLMALVFGFFAPLFFLHAGTRIDLSNLDHDYIIIALVLFLVATALKYIGTAIPAFVFIKDRANFCGILFNYRLSFGIITANVGLESGVIQENMFSVIMLVVVFSAAIPGVFLRNSAIPEEKDRETVL